MSITDTVTSMATGFAHDVSTIAQDAAHSAVDLGKQAVDSGRSGLHSAGILPKRRSLFAPSMSTVAIVAGIAVVSWMIMRKAGKSGAATGADSPETMRLADKTHVRVA